MSGTHRLLLLGEGGSYLTVDCDLVEQFVETRVYHTVGESDIRAVRVNDEGAAVLKEDEEQEMRVILEREKEAPHELYIYGGAVYATEATVEFSGEYHCSGSLPGYASNTKVRVNDCILHGEGSVDNSWDWTIIERGDATVLYRSDEFANTFNKNTCFVVGFDRPIETLQMVQDLV